MDLITYTLLAEAGPISKEALDESSSTILSQAGAIGGVLLLFIAITVPVLWWILRNFRKVNDEQRKDYEKDKAETAERNAAIFAKYMDLNEKCNEKRAKIAEDATRAITMVMTKVDGYVDTQNKLLEKMNEKSDDND
jgi:F0F1-type ATP synthase membrane subunit b/b'